MNQINIFFHINRIVLFFQFSYSLLLAYLLNGLRKIVVLQLIYCIQCMFHYQSCVRCNSNLCSLIGHISKENLSTSKIYIHIYYFQTSVPVTKFLLHFSSIYICIYELGCTFLRIGVPTYFQKYFFKNFETILCKCIPNIFGIW